MMKKTKNSSIAEESFIDYKIKEDHRILSQIAPGFSQVTEMINDASDSNIKRRYQGQSSKNRNSIFEEEEEGSDYNEEDDLSESVENRSFILTKTKEKGSLKICGKCFKKCKNGSKCINCKYCSEIFHRACVKITHNKPFVCSSCKTFRTSQKPR